MFGMDLDWVDGLGHVTLFVVQSLLHMWDRPPLVGYAKILAACKSLLKRTCDLGSLALRYKTRQAAIALGNTADAHLWMLKATQILTRINTSLARQNVFLCPVFFYSTEI
jgi:hypothetical protein